MDNPFKNILTNEKVPEILRDKVINDVGIIKLTLDVADLFVVKCPGTIKEFLKSDGNTQSNKKSLGENTSITHNSNKNE